MLARLHRICLPILLAATFCVASAQTEEEDMNFAVGAMGVQISRLLAGDLTDRSSEFPKNPYGDVTKGIYGFVRKSVARTTDIDVKLQKTELMKVAGLEWLSSPKAAIREIAKMSALYGEAKRAHLADRKAIAKLMLDSADDTPLMATFKAGMRNGYEQTSRNDASIANYNAFLIFLSTLEDVYYHIDHNRSDIEVVSGPLLIFKTELNNISFEQKLNRMEKAAEIIEKLANITEARQKEIIKGLKGYGSGSG